MNSNELLIFHLDNRGRLVDHIPRRYDYAANIIRGIRLKIKGAASAGEFIYILNVGKVIY